jgi:hypothetical protein
MTLHDHAGIPVGRARPKNHHLGLDLDMQRDLLSFLQSNVAQGQFGFSQTVDYLAKGNPRSARAMMATVQRMTVIVLSFNINRIGAQVHFLTGGGCRA